MAFWLAPQRSGQSSSYIQRFDPRFWTVNFPRPMMASVTTPAPDAIQVDCEFYNQGDLAGLIWECEDTLDHPLLAYETSRDFSHTSLSFHWQSSGIMPLDQANGPTLTIEGRDASGTARTWYIRLWNYASGTPTNAQITLPFSDLGSGWVLPGEAVHPADIDRMFISLVSPDYAGGSNAPLPNRQNGRVTITAINCDGHNAMLEIGNVLVPPHGERMATAYDDAYNQTPARLVRNIIGLGYRDEVVHYLGMSHYPALTSTGIGSVEVAQPAKLSEPAEHWHNAFFGECKTADLEVIASLSYELFDAYAPSDWKQRAHDGEPALTGWVPPSTLLSPANTVAMTWLHKIATDFTALLESAVQPVRFQIGEPWWWVTPAGKPCLYDTASTTEFGGDPAVISDMRAPMDPAQTALLDQAGVVLGQSTLDLADAVRNAANNGAEILLLAFTPTILDPQMPELYRANLPLEWAYPAFDRLQLEDYDWLTAGADAARRSAYDFVDTRLAYPIADQDYLSGFVLLAEDAEAYWQRIDAALDEAAARGVERRFVWALPQVARDGYTRLPPQKEDNMLAFDDVLYPLPLGRSVAVSPEFSTSVAVTASGHERRNSLWSDARIHFDVGPGVRSEEELSELIGFFRARRGAARGFRVTDPFDFSSNEMSKQPTATDQVIGIADGLVSDFQLIKTYGDTEEPQLRRITRPKPASIVVSIDGQETQDWELGEAGVISFDAAPSAGAEIRAGFLFDVPARFAEDRIDVSGINFEAGEAPSVPLVEIREGE
jgi:uncharacterized protein (TIGR02217 family)